MTSFCSPSDTWRVMRCDGPNENDTVCPLALEAGRKLVERRLHCGGADNSDLGHDVSSNVTIVAAFVPIHPTGCARLDGRMASLGCGYDPLYGSSLKSSHFLLGWRPSFDMIGIAGASITSPGSNPGLTAIDEVRASPHESPVGGVE